MRAIDAGAVGDVHRDSHHALAVERASSLLELDEVTTRHHHPKLEPSKLPAHLQPDPAIRTGHDRNT
jgi:hypothetical protein